MMYKFRMYDDEWQQENDLNPYSDLYGNETQLAKLEAENKRLEAKVKALTDAYAGLQKQHAELVERSTEATGAMFQQWMKEREAKAQLPKSPEKSEHIEHSPTGLVNPREGRRLGGYPSDIFLKKGNDNPKAG